MPTKQLPSWKMLKGKSEVYPDTMCSLTWDKVNFYSGNPPLVISTDGEFWVGFRNLWKDGNEAVERCQFCRQSCLGITPLREWIAACLEMEPEEADSHIVEEMDAIENLCIMVEGVC